MNTKILGDFEICISVPLNILQKLPLLNQLSKKQPVEINYVEVKYYDNISFAEDLKTAFSNNDIQTCENFEQIVMNC